MFLSSQGCISAPWRPTVNPDGIPRGSGSTKAGTGVAVGLRYLSPKELLPLLPWRLKNTWFLSAQTCWAGLYLSRCLSSGESPQCEQFNVQSRECFLQTPGRLYLGTASAGTWHVPRIPWSSTHMLPSSIGLCLSKRIHDPEWLHHCKNNLKGWKKEKIRGLATSPNLGCCKGISSNTDNNGDSYGHQALQAVSSGCVPLFKTGITTFKTEWCSSEVDPAEQPRPDLANREFGNFVWDKILACFSKEKPQPVPLFGCQPLCSGFAFPDDF